MHADTTRQQRRGRALRFIPFRRWLIRRLEVTLETLRPAAGGEPAVLRLPSPFLEENTVGTTERSPHVRAEAPSQRRFLWEWALALGIMGVASTLYWQSRHLVADVADTVQALQEQVTAQTRQMQTHAQQLDIHAIQLLAQTQRLDVVAHDTASHKQQLSRQADLITLNTQRLDAHADEFVLRIAQLDAQTEQLDTHAHQLAQQTQTLQTQTPHLSILRAHPATSLTPLENGHRRTWAGTPPVLEAFAPLHGAAALPSPDRKTSAIASQPASPRSVITLPADLGAVALRGSSRATQEREQP